MYLELQRAKGMGDAFDGVRLSVREIVSRIDTPGIKRARVMGADEAYRYMLDRAKDCDREMAVIQS